MTKPENKLKQNKPNLKKNQELTLKIFNKNKAFFDSASTKKSLSFAEKQRNARQKVDQELLKIPFVTAKLKKAIKQLETTCCHGSEEITFLTSILEKAKKEIRLRVARTGSITILVKRRNIFVNLSSFKENKILFASSLGKIKVKGRRRIANPLFEDFTELLIEIFKKSPIKNFFLLWKGGYLQRIKQESLLEKLDWQENIKFLKLYMPNSRSHNGCRLPKIRRK